MRIRHAFRSDPTVKQSCLTTLANQRQKYFPVLDDRVESQDVRHEQWRFARLQKYANSAYHTLTGKMPETLIHVITDAMNNSKPIDEAVWIPERICEAMEPGCDMRRAMDTMALWLLAAPDSPLAEWVNKDWMSQAADLCARAAKGEAVFPGEWQEASQTIAIRDKNPSWQIGSTPLGCAIEAAQSCVLHRIGDWPNISRAVTWAVRASCGSARKAAYKQAKRTYEADHPRPPGRHRLKLAEWRMAANAAAKTEAEGAEYRTRQVEWKTIGFTVQQCCAAPQPTAAAGMSP